MVCGNSSANIRHRGHRSIGRSECDFIKRKEEIRSKTSISELKPEFPLHPAAALSKLPDTLVRRCGIHTFIFAARFRPYPFLEITA